MGNPRRALIAAVVLILGLAAFAAAVHARPAPANTLPLGFADQLVFRDVTQPTRVAFAPDGSVYVAEKRGRILRFATLQATTPTVAADLRTEVYSGWDRGIVGLAVDPAFTTGRPYLYALYTLDALPGGTAPNWSGDDCPTPPGFTTHGCVVMGRLVRMTVANGTVTQTKVLIEDWCQQYTSHSVGDLRFGPDGALYASAGDGASYTFVDKGQVSGGTSPTTLVANPCSDPANEGGALRSLDALTPSDPHTLDGTLIRIDPDTGAARPDNPWAAAGDVNRRRIVAFGMRNPWRFTFRPGTSEVWAADVGWKAYEELNRIQLGTGAVPNLGWPCYEGNGKQPDYDEAGIPLCQGLAPDAVTAPYYAYGRVAIAGCGQTTTSASAVAFATNPRYPAAYRGALFFSDYARGCVFTMQTGPNGLPITSTFAPFLKGRPVVDLQTGPGNDLFYVDIAAGEVRRLVASGTNRVPVAAVTATAATGPAPLTVNFDARGSSDPDPGDELRYEWDLDADGQFDDGTGTTATSTYPTARTLAVRVRVTDSYGLSAIASVTVSAGNQPPVPTIVTPAATLTWATGDPISFSGNAQDPQQGTLPASALDWKLIVVHCGDDGTQCHEHQVATWTGVASGQFAAPAHEWPSKLKLVLTARDNAGASASVERLLEPRTATLSIASNPPGISITAVNGTNPTPFTRTVITGTTVTVSAPATAVINGA
ncbi:MAG: PQQ-dependent sugar dehydrogenase, partial [Acidimicrobiales bacterium]